MREIKFRAWSSEDMFYDWGIDSGLGQAFYLSTMSHVTKILAKSNGYDLPEIFKWQKEIVFMQYTELKDKNGKEIYEGDIVKYFKDELGVVKFLKNCFCIESNSDIEFMCDLSGGIEVVGNIYEDPKMISI